MSRKLRAVGGFSPDLTRGAYCKPSAGEGPQAAHCPPSQESNLPLSALRASSRNDPPTAFLTHGTLVWVKRPPPGGARRGEGWSSSLRQFVVRVLQDLSYGDKHWHDKCFKCSSCPTSLVNESFAFKNDQLYCAACYEQMFAPRCTRCNQVFRAGQCYPPTSRPHYAFCPSVCPSVLCAHVNDVIRLENSF